MANLIPGLSGLNVFVGGPIQHAERFGADTARFTPDQVAIRDFSWMRRCDVFVPVLPVDERGELLRGLRESGALEVAR